MSGLATDSRLGCQLWRFRYRIVLSHYRIPPALRHPSYRIDPKSTKPIALTIVHRPSLVDMYRKRMHGIYATSWTTPPASLIFRSASLEKYRARTMIGTAGRRPFPRTLEYPRGRRSRTGATEESLLVRYFSRCSTGTRDQSYH